MNDAAKTGIEKQLADRERALVGLRDERLRALTQSEIDRLRAILARG